MKRSLFSMAISLGLAAGVIQMGCGGNPSAPQNSATPTPTSTFTVTPTATNTFLPTPVATNAWGTGGQPMGVVIVGSNLYVANYTLDRVDKYSLGGVKDLSWTPPVSDRASGLAIDGSGNLYVGNGGLNQTISKFNAQATPIATWITGGTASQLLALDGSGGLYLATHTNNMIEKYDTSGNFGLSWANNDWPTAITISGSTVYVGGWINNRLSRYQLDGTSLGGWDLASWGCAAIGLDGLGRIYAAGYNGPIQRFDGTGLLETQWGGYPCYGLALDASNNIYVSDSSYGIRVFAP